MYIFVVKRDKNTRETSLQAYLMKTSFELIYSGLEFLVLTRERQKYLNELLGSVGFHVNHEYRESRISRNHDIYCVQYAKLPTEIRVTHFQEIKLIILYRQRLSLPEHGEQSPESPLLY